MPILELVGPAEGGDGGHLLGAVLLVARVPAHAVVVAVAAPGAVDAVAVAALEPAVRTPADNSRVNINTAILNIKCYEYDHTDPSIPEGRGAGGRRYLHRMTLGFIATIATVYVPVTFGGQGEAGGRVQTLELCGIAATIKQY